MLTLISVLDFIDPFLIIVTINTKEARHIREGCKYEEYSWPRNAIHRLLPAEQMKTGSFLIRRKSLETNSSISVLWLSAQNTFLCL
jgi:hypothetical protein